ncbi:hypothetical protein EYZ11_001326 [Aspergillus tanneri]|uniref:Uncharacterized protein n=1 Tax=Aspergillus tanneri TaxID=1220188 RepID=A0A4S3JV00_9EURO|nr:hypothetical protein EYZ11_001326 [Aspergillus tanneri]
MTHHGDSYLRRPRSQHTSTYFALCQV